MAKGIVRRIKRYVAVTAHFDVAGRLIPTAIEWEDGRHWEIDQVKDVRRAASLKTGGDGMRYTIRIGERVTYLFYEDPRWFVEEKVVEMPS
jgi:hypothetical protein